MGHWSRTKDLEGNFWLYSTIKSLLLSHQMKASKDRKADSSSFWQIRRLCICLHAKIWWLWFVTKDFNEMWISLNELNKPKGKYWLDITWPWWEFTQPSQLSLQNSTYVIRGKKINILISNCTQVTARVTGPWCISWKHGQMFSYLNWGSFV